jgi:pseudaminic acid cytidylyltransferase
MNVAVIPARGGSKRIPGKNIRPFCGKPIIAWSIEVALASKLFDEVMVSTDDAEIAEVAARHGAAVPFLRSPATADDHATITDVLREVLSEYRNRGTEFDTACCIYSTAPFVSAADLVEGHAILQRDARDVVLPVCRFDYPIWRSLKRDDEGRVSLFFPEHELSRSQDLPTAFHDAGQWLWLRVGPFLGGAALLGGNTGSMVLQAERVQDIDTEEDWRRAERKFQDLAT